ncbi:hypothetical protein ACROYT_G004880 [Oculina patagonica]
MKIERKLVQANEAGSSHGTEVEVAKRCFQYLQQLDKLYKECNHGVLEPRRWIQVGTLAYDKLSSLLFKTALLNDIKNLSPGTQTSCLEGVHATLNYWHPKLICYSLRGSFCRHILAILHFNENIYRETQVSKDGKEYIRVTYPKFKLVKRLFEKWLLYPLTVMSTS